VEVNVFFSFLFDLWKGGKGEGRVSFFFLTTFFHWVRGEGRGKIVAIDMCVRGRKMGFIELVEWEYFC